MFICLYYNNTNYNWAVIFSNENVKDCDKLKLCSNF
jgi:hypothetical protein